MTLTVERLREVLDYDPATGVFRWRPMAGKGRGRAGREAGHINDKGRRQICVDGKLLYASRLAWLYMTGAWPRQQIDHKNLDRLDNSFANLREADNSRNCSNRRVQKNNLCGHKGVRRHCLNRWQATIGFQNESIYLGLFPSLEAAVAARSEAARRLHGEFARTE